MFLSFSEHPEALSCLLLQLRREKYDQKKKILNKIYTYLFLSLIINVCLYSYFPQAKWGNGEDGLESSLSPRGPVHHKHPQTLGVEIRWHSGRTHQGPANQKQQPAPQKTEVTRPTIQNDLLFCSSLLWFYFYRRRFRLVCCSWKLTLYFCLQSP